MVPARNASCYGRLHNGFGGIWFSDRVPLAKTPSGLKTLRFQEIQGILYRMIRWLNVLLHLAVAGLKSRRDLLHPAAPDWRCCVTMVVPGITMIYLWQN